MNFANAFFAEAAAFETEGVQSVRMSPALGSGFGERKNVAGNGRPAADESMRADAHKVVHRTQRAYRGPILDDDMSTQGGSVCENDVIADHAVMGDVRVGHDQRVAADARQASALD